MHPLLRCECAGADSRLRRENTAQMLARHVKFAGNRLQIKRAVQMRRNQLLCCAYQFTSAGKHFRALNRVAEARQSVMHNLCPFRRRHKTYGAPLAPVCFQMLHETGVERQPEHIAVTFIHLADDFNGAEPVE